MLTPEKLFGNLFEADREKTTPARLAEFATDALARVAAEDTDNVLNNDAQAVSDALDAMDKERDEVDTAFNRQLGKTTTVDSVMDAFIRNMRDNEGVIAKMLGGEGSEGYLRFYPAGMGQYTKMTKANAPVYIKRVHDAATDLSATLGTALTAELQAHLPAWDTARGAQTDQKGEVAGNRGERNDTRLALELALTKLIHGVAYHWPGDVAQGSRFFSFHILDAARHKSLEKPANE